MKIADLQIFEPLRGVPDHQLQWLIDHGEMHQFEKGDMLFQKGHPSDHMNMVVEGKFHVYSYVGENRKLFGSFERGDLTGLLPYSRLKIAVGDGVSVGHSKVFTVHRSKMPEMIRENYELTQNLVHFMTSRVREFSQMQMQNEKLMALGKLSAGLAHELNNPASAIRRSALELQRHLKALPDTFKEVMSLQLSPQLSEELNEMIFTKVDSPTGEEMPLRERTRLEDEMADLLESSNIDDPFEFTENLVFFGFSTEDIQQIMQLSRSDDFPIILRWIDQNLITERMVSEIEEASARIADLVGSMKQYSYMDRNVDWQEIDIRQGIRNTLKILDHKIRKGGHKVDLVLCDPCPNIHGLPGELNQVWTNLIDNAIDAMENRPGVLSIHSEMAGNFIKVTISDTGSGIPEEVRYRIFEPFFTTKEMGKGTGLGLDIVNKIMKQHNGDIQVHSKPGRTTFELSFPLEIENK
ncbi:MAG: GHKL domain-containing protein [Bacteroidota bacterium]|nr:GHKL domain-containing protein [Bacteroidota bacterium]MDX5428795.1 GHKL domain-containing protein [Bacteroidota bacterium]MDX5447084.1 GHKL domain-containing protein [Bacteroidota bacterium]